MSCPVKFKCPGSQTPALLCFQTQASESLQLTFLEKSQPPLLDCWAGDNPFVGGYQIEVLALGLISYQG